MLKRDIRRKKERLTGEIIGCLVKKSRSECCTPLFFDHLVKIVLFSGLKEDKNHDFNSHNQK